jgi:hypothetical protein
MESIEEFVKYNDVQISRCERVNSNPLAEWSNQPGIYSYKILLTMPVRSRLKELEVYFSISERVLETLVNGNTCPLAVRVMFRDYPKNSVGYARAMDFAANAYTPSTCTVLEQLARESIVVDTSDNFMAWCCRLGFDSTLKESKSAYRNCKKQRIKLRQFLGSTEYHNLLYNTGTGFS